MRSRARLGLLLGASLNALMLAGCDRLQDGKATPTGSAGTTAEMDATLTHQKAGSTRTLAEIDAALKRIEMTGTGPRWVLWRASTYLDFAQLSLPYFALEGFNWKEECERGMAYRIARATGRNIFEVIAEKYGAGSSGTGSSYQTTEGARGRVVYEFYCLPDTVDPRQHAH